MKSVYCCERTERNGCTVQECEYLFVNSWIFLCSEMGDSCLNTSMNIMG